MMIVTHQVIGHQRSDRNPEKRTVMCLSQVSDAVAMEPAWRQQGRGRGRGQEGRGERSRPLQPERQRLVGGGGRPKAAAAPEPQCGRYHVELGLRNLESADTDWFRVFDLTGVSVQSKFLEIRKSDQAAAQRLVESCIVSSSSEDEDDDGAGDHEEGKTGKILALTFTSYTTQTGELRAGDMSQRRARQAGPTVSCHNATLRASPGSPVVPELLLCLCLQTVTLQV